MASVEFGTTWLAILASVKAYFKFSSGALTTDSSGNSNTLTPIGVYSQNFDSLNNGDLNGQDSWSAHASYDVQESVKAQGAKAVSFPNNLDVEASRTITAVSSGRIHISVRTTSNSQTGPFIRLMSGASYLGIVFFKNDGNITIYTGSTTLTVSSFSANTWYDIIIDFDCSTDQYRVSSDNGATFTDWVNFYNNNTATTVSILRFGSGTASTSSTGYVDDIYFTPILNASGKFGGAVLLNGTVAYSASDNSGLKPTGAFTIGGWLKVTTPASGTIFQSYSINTNVAGIKLGVASTGKPYLVSGKNTGATLGTDYQQANGDTVVEDGNWHFVVGVWDGDYLRIYVDADLDALAVSWSNAPAYAATNYVRIGCANNTGSNIVFINGSLDDLFFINGKALSAEEISGIYDGSIKTPTATFSETITHTSSLTTLRTTLKTMIEAITNTDSLLAKITGKTFSEITTISTSKISSISRTLSDTSGITDAISFLFVYLRVLHETITTSDFILRSVSVVRAEISTISDSISRTIDRVRTFTETITNTDSIITGMKHCRTFVETITMSDLIAYFKKIALFIVGRINGVKIVGKIKESINFKGKIK